ncbi:MAG: rod shape-determining protein MreC [Petrimonas sp.]|uniref:rod shape-determining protein MreC n=1 Tax=Petrimonas sp. TaxID=2023866 RepID=UPI002B3906BC|nr:rod shape-determining protein MreC [Petrimonas sp.]
MRNLLTFIIRNSSWLVAIVLIVFSFHLLFSYNSYQRSVYLSSANNVTGWFYETSNKATTFIHLSKNNKLLLERNAQLESELYSLKTHLQDMQMDTLTTNAFLSDSIPVSQFSFIPAEVTNVSFSGPNTFITVNKGSLHGVKPDMGVVSQNGVVGVVLTVSPKFSVIIPIINPKFRLSGKLKNSNNTGSISWDGKDLNVAQIGELPKHEVFQPGDTVLTSFSRIFPKDIVIGYVIGQIPSKDDNFNTLNVRIATDFYSVRDIHIIDDKYYDEQKQLENSIP